MSAEQPIARAQHVTSSTLVLMLALVVGWLSFTEQPGEAYLFPRLIAIFFVLFAFWNFMRAVLGLAKVGSGVSKSDAQKLLPGLLVSSLFVLWAAKYLGFYVSSACVFVIICTLYENARLSDVGAWLRRVIVAVGFVAVIYGLFALLLKVHTPKGIFF